jgi:TetR/AcrR family transcriptional regulator, transcriptional repressor for nem operon
VRVSREQAVKNRERILDVSANLFRAHGFDGVGVDDVMKHAGLTHGGFYGHFASKEDLIGQCCSRAFSKIIDGWTTLIRESKTDQLQAVAAAYVSRRHRDNPGAGCLIAALGPEVSRQGPAVRGAITVGVRSFTELLSKVVSGRSRSARRKKALATYASLVGALVLARAVEDPALSDEILHAVKASVLGGSGPERPS